MKFICNFALTGEFFQAEYGLTIDVRVAWICACRSWIFLCSERHRPLLLWTHGAQEVLLVLADECWSPFIFIRSIRISHLISFNLLINKTFNFKNWLCWLRHQCSICPSASLSLGPCWICSTCLEYFHMLCTLPYYFSEMKVRILGIFWTNIRLFNQISTSLLFKFNLFDSLRSVVTDVNVVVVPICGVHVLTLKVTRFKGHSQLAVGLSYCSTYNWFNLFFTQVINPTGRPCPCHNWHRCFTSIIWK